PIVRVGFAYPLVRRVEIWRERLELGGAGVHALVDGGEGQRCAPLAHGSLGCSGGKRELGVPEAGALQAAHRAGVQTIQAEADRRTAHVGDLAELTEEPGVDPRELVNLVDGPTA